MGKNSDGKIEVEGCSQEIAILKAIPALRFILRKEKHLSVELSEFWKVSYSPETNIFTIHARIAGVVPCDLYVTMAMVEDYAEAQKDYLKGKK